MKMCCCAFRPEQSDIWTCSIFKVGTVIQDVPNPYAKLTSLLSAKILVRHLLVCDMLNTIPLNPTSSNTRFNIHIDTNNF
jgi:hypothetical protein